MLSRFPHDRAHRTILTAVKNVKLINRLSGTKCLKYCVATLYFCFFHTCLCIFHSYSPKLCISAGILSPFTDAVTSHRLPAPYPAADAFWYHSF